jgi:hypothetical protein
MALAGRAALAPNSGAWPTWRRFRDESILRTPQGDPQPQHRARVRRGYTPTRPASHPVGCINSIFPCKTAGCPPADASPGKATDHADKPRGWSSDRSALPLPLAVRAGVASRSRPLADPGFAARSCFCTPRADRLRISRARVSVLTNRSDFPRPVGRLGRSDVWRWATVERWARETRRLTPAD